MTFEEAIKTALDYENKVYKTYIEAVRNSKDVSAKKFFELMAEEEKSHVDYLESKLKQWQETEELDASEIATAIPAASRIAEGLAKVKEKLEKAGTHGAFGTELASLRKALDAETETSAFYQKMVSELQEDGQKLFRRFLEIEEGHKAIVAAELDAVENNGFWFDIQEFDQELD